MHPMKRLWLLGWQVGVLVGFAGLGVLGLGMMVGVFVYPTGVGWGVVVFLLGLLGLLVALASGMTYLERPRPSGT